MPRKVKKSKAKLVAGPNLGPVLPTKFRNPGGLLAGALVTQPSIHSKPLLVPRWLLLALSLMPVLVSSEVPIDLDEALGGAGLTWVTGGSVPWLSQNMVAVAGVVAAASGSVGDSQSSFLETSVIGPGRVVYRWAVSSEPSFDLLRFEVNGTAQLERSGLVPWQMASAIISASGTQVLRWVYVKDVSVSMGRDQAYLDQVLWIPNGAGGVSVELMGNGTGSVVSGANEPDIDCGPSCIATAPLGTTVTLEATPQPGSAFEGWFGACSGTQSTCTVALSQWDRVHAKFSDSSLDEELSAGGQVSGISGSALSVKRFYVDVPSNAQDLVVRLTGPDSINNNVFLSVAHDRLPEGRDSDCSPAVEKASQVCAFASPFQGRYYIAVGGESDTFSGIDLSVNYDLSASQHMISLTSSAGGRLVSSDVIFPVETIDGPIYTPEIVGGGDSTVEQWPWQVQLRKGSAFCGGSLISPNWVVTAAHCLDNGPVDTVVLGRTALNSGGVERSVVESIVHESYANFNYDIALLRLDEPMTYEPSIQPIGLLSAAQEANLAKNGVLASVSGWGLLYPETSVRSDQLQAVDVAMVSTEACRNSSYPASSITNNMICAGFVEGGVDACAGDSGGPLVVRDRIGGYRLVGITSWGDGCAKPNFPGVYTRVSKFVSWVEDKTGLSFPDTILDCGERCQVTVPNDTELTLLPEPDPGYFFVGFDGICAGQMTCPLNVTTPQSIQAQFAPIAIFQDRFESQ